MTDSIDKDGLWHDFFAILPVTIDAYRPDEIKDGRTSYLRIGWVQRRWDVWDDEDLNTHAVWRYRLKRSEEPAP